MLTSSLVPIASAAREFTLPLHQIDTFTGWQVNVLVLEGTWISSHALY